MKKFSWTCAALMCICLVFLFYYYSIIIINNNNGLNTFQTTMEEMDAIGKMQKQKTRRRKRLLRIAQIAVLEERVPPKKYGGSERIIAYLTEELVRRGHQVTLFASSNSVTSAKLVAKWPNLNDHPVADKSVPYKWMMNQVKRRANQFDILHFHTESRQIEIVDAIFRKNKSALVLTEHWLISPIFAKQYKHIPHISISYDQRKHLDPAGAKFIANVYHGLPKNLYTFVHKPIEERYLAFLGRITPEKAPDWAIEIAVRAGIPLKIAAKAEPNDPYWTNKIWPMIEKHGNLIEFVGEIDDSEKSHFLGNAYALLFPINWPEPFGLVMIEAMACGTPVIGRRLGSVPEVVDEGVTGWLFDSTEQAVEAIGKVAMLDRTKVRRTFERRFTVETMADNYEHVYYHQMLGIE